MTLFVMKVLQANNAIYKWHKFPQSKKINPLKSRISTKSTDEHIFEGIEN